jgi:hypothetical protein
MTKKIFWWLWSRLQPKYRRSGLDLTVEWKEAPDENQEKLTAERVHSIFKSIPDSICHILGMDPRHGRPLKSIKARLKGKEGRI